MQGVVGISESERGRPVNDLPDPVAHQQLEPAQAALVAAIERGDDAQSLRSWFTALVADHHLSCGHGAIYSQKAFEPLDMIGWDRAATVLSHLVCGPLPAGRHRRACRRGRPHSTSVDRASLPTIELFRSFALRCSLAVLAQDATTPDRRGVSVGRRMGVVQGMHQVEPTQPPPHSGSVENIRRAASEVPRISVSRSPSRTRRRTRCPTPCQPRCRWLAGWRGP